MDQGRFGHDGAPCLGLRRPCGDELQSESAATEELTMRSPSAPRGGTTPVLFLPRG